MTFEDAREFKSDCRTLTHRILKKMRECEKYNIDYDTYLNRIDLEIANEVLDCCLKHKNNPKISRRTYEV